MTTDGSVGLARGGGRVEGLWRYLKDKKKWWLPPLVLFLALVVLLLLLSEGSSLTTRVYSPF